MKKPRSLGIMKFDSMLKAAIVEMAVDVLMSLIDTGVTGHIIGLSGLSAMNLLAPLLGVTLFTEGVYSVGCSRVYAAYIGKFRKEDARRAFGTGMVLALGIGIFTSLAAFLLMPAYLDYMDVTDEIKTLVHNFMLFLYFELAMKPAYELACQIVYADGGENTGMAASIAESLLNLLLSIFLGRKMGIMGIGLGTLISTLAASCIILTYYIRRGKDITPMLSFVKADAKEMFLFGANDSAMFFLLPMMFFIMTKFVIVEFGEFYLPVLTIINSLLEMTVVFEATGEAMLPIMPIYVGNRDTDSISALLDHSMRINIVLGAVFSAVLLGSAELIPLAFDITEPTLQSACANGLRIYAIAGPGLAILANYNSYYLNTGKRALAFFESILNQLVCILIIAVPLGRIFGVTGMWFGYALAPYLAELILFGYIIMKYGKNHSLSLLERTDEPTLIRTLPLNDAEITLFSEEAGAFLDSRGVPPITQNRVSMLIDDLLMLIREYNTKERENGKDSGEDEPLYAECFIRITADGIDLSIWDNGKIFDITESSSTGSFREYIVSKIMITHPEKRYIAAASFNRNSFSFPFVAKR